ncbi:hypothetical protein BGZ65_000059, partial [Modicella reniformis]
MVRKKSKKDPGIPNNFPFKEQLLQQIVDEKMKAQEEELKEKEARRKAAEKARQANKAEIIIRQNKSAEGAVSKVVKRKASGAEAETKSKKSKTAVFKKEDEEDEEEEEAEEAEEDVDEDAPYNFAEHLATSAGAITQAVNDNNAFLLGKNILTTYECLDVYRREQASGSVRTLQKTMMTALQRHPDPPMFIANALITVGTVAVIKDIDPDFELAISEFLVN